MLRLKEGAMKSLGTTGSNPRAVAKKTVMVAIYLADGSTLMANMFVKQFSRLTDLLNDERAFLPVQTPDGQYIALAKSFIRQVSLKGDSGNAPRKLLGVESAPIDSACGGG